MIHDDRPSTHSTRQKVPEMPRSRTPSQRTSHLMGLSSAAPRLVEEVPDPSLHPLQVGHEVDLRAEPRRLRGAVADEETHAASEVSDLVEGLADREDVDPLQVEGSGGWRVAPNRD